ncbi:hypothetical protein PR048_011511 [Dryococelus australis]|uniref:Uncharacterized protein n=1 Tax=Dryococelus australis TaxID=614101 RepID=A0ABQ9HLQ8_9NEOP|nr:hypothetical protein PR048_011511 [Dryococelus australis]
MSIIIVDFTSLSQKSMLIVYVRVLIEGINLGDTESSLGFTEEFPSEHLISLTCDGATIMFGSCSGVATLFKEKFPSIVVWHRASHRLELYVNDAVKEVGGMNRF